MSDTAQECNTRFNNILVTTQMILQRRDRGQIKQLVEFWIGLGDELSKWNTETHKILYELSKVRFGD